jgi:mannonate dehydratase
MKISKRIANITDSELQYAKQLGVGHIIGYLPDDGDHAKWDFLSFVRLRRLVESHGLELAAIGSLPAGLMSQVMLAGAERDEAINRICRFITSIGKAGVPTLCYNFALLGNWGRWRDGMQGGGRGGAGVMSFDYELVKDAPITEHGTITADEMWDRLIYFLQRVVPVAEDAGVRLACHPDDPPVPVLRGIARIQTNVADFKRLVGIAPSPCNGLTFCVGTTAEAGADVLDAIRYFATQKKIFVVHFRNIRRLSIDPLKFDETFIDEGELDMLDVMQALLDVGYGGLLDPDHAPVLETDSQWGRERGYAYTYGYIAGLRDYIESARIL